MTTNNQLTPITIKKLFNGGWNFDIPFNLVLEVLDQFDEQGKQVIDGFMFSSFIVDDKIKFEDFINPRYQDKDLDQYFEKYLDF